MRHQPTPCLNFRIFPPDGLTAHPAMPKFRHVPTAPDLIGAKDAADILGIDRSTLLRWVNQGRIRPAHQMEGGTGAYLFHRTDIEHTTNAAEPAGTDSAA